MIDGQTCSSCVAFSALTNECRAKSPTPVVVPGPAGNLVTIGAFPATRAENWCGEWRTKPIFNPAGG